MSKIVIAYIPVLHSGYVDFLKRHRDATAFLILGSEQLKDFDHLVRKDIRALEPEQMLEALRSLNLFSDLRILNHELIRKILERKYRVVMPEEDESHHVAEKYFSQLHVEYDSVFLRWDKSRSIKEVKVTSETITLEEFDRQCMGLAISESQKSSDWWRQVGAVVVKDTLPVIVGYNHHEPSARTPYVFGDPRGSFSKGVGIELTTAIHAEASVIAEAARRGIALAGTSLYVTTFPCPMCARLIAHSGIKTCYYGSGYGVLDGEEMLRRANVSLIRVEGKAPPD